VQAAFGLPVFARVSADSIIPEAVNIVHYSGASRMDLAREVFVVADVGPGSGYLILTGIRLSLY
jgi:hypothetical protein